MPVGHVKNNMENLPLSCISLILYLKLMLVGFYRLMLLLGQKLGLKFGSRGWSSASFSCFNHAAMAFLRTDFHFAFFFLAERCFFVSRHWDGAELRTGTGAQAAYRAGFWLVSLSRLSQTRFSGGGVRVETFYLDGLFVHEQSHFVVC